MLMHKLLLDLCHGLTFSQYANNGLQQPYQVALALTLSLPPLLLLLLLAMPTPEGASRGYAPKPSMCRFSQVGTSEARDTPHTGSPVLTTPLYYHCYWISHVTFSPSLARCETNLFP